MFFSHVWHDYLLFHVFSHFSPISNVICYGLLWGRSPSWELCCRILSTSSGVRLNAASFAHSSPKSTLSTHCSLLVMSWETFLETFKSFKFCIFNEILGEHVCLQLRRFCSKVPLMATLHNNLENHRTIPIIYQHQCSDTLVLRGHLKRVR